MRVVFFGMLGRFSVPPLQALLNAGFDVCAVVVPALLSGVTAIAPLSPPRRVLNLLAGEDGQHTIVQIAAQHGIPVWEVRRFAAPETLATVASLRTEVGCVACFSKRLPAALLALLPHGLLNVHPSLLPRGRGPEPLFWTFRNDEQAGVTVHLVSEGLDAGDIVAQLPLALPDGIAYSDAERRLATTGGALLVAALRELTHGTLARQPQTGCTTYAPQPADDDFVVSADWSAQRVFNFLRGTAEWGQSYFIEIGGARRRLGEALSYDANAVLDAPYTQHRDATLIQCAPGVLRVQTFD